jgi:hypothetical protein
VYKENFCLYQTKTQRTDQTGRLCVKDLDIMVADTIIYSEFSAEGVLGLSPSKG